MARYRDSRTGRFTTIQKARDFNEVICKVDVTGAKVSKNFRPPPIFSGLKIRDIKTGKYINSGGAGGKWVQLEKWSKGKRVETGAVNRYSSKDIERIKKRLKGIGGAGGEYIGLLNEYEKAKREWQGWGNDYEKAITFSKMISTTENLFKAKLRGKEKTDWAENEDMIDGLLMDYLHEQNQDDLADMTAEQFTDFINNYLEEVRGNLDDLEGFAVPF